MELTQLAAVALALAIGLTLGALGSGGSIIALPVLVYVAGVEPRTAVAMSLTIVGAASLAGALLHWRRGSFHPKAAAVFGAAGLPGALLGAEFTHAVPPHALMLAFSILLVIVGALMWRGAPSRLASGTCRLAPCAAIGVGVGALTGFLGVGGGFLIVPSLILFAGLATHQAVGTSLGIIGLNCASGLVRQIRLVPLDWTLTAIFLGAVLLGMGIGMLLHRRVDARALNRALAGVLIATGIVIFAAQIGSR